MIKTLKKINLLLDRKQKTRMIFLVIMMLIGAMLEAVGITLIIPILEAVINPSAIDRNKYHMGDLYRLLGMHSVREFAIVLMVAIVVAFAVKNIYLYIEQKALLKFIYTNQFATSNRMMINFMKRPYEYYLNAKTSIIQRNITSDINNVYALILNILQLVSELIVFVILFGILLAVDAKMILVITVLLVLVLALIKKFIKPVMLQAGRDNQDYYAGLFKWISESVDAIKEIKIADKENYFITEYSKCGNGYVNAVQKYTLYSSTPRLAIEWICVAGLVLYMIFEVATGTGDMSTLITQMGVFGLTAARLLPSANRINNYLTNISYFTPFLDNVSDNLQSEIHDRNISYQLEDYPAGESVDKLPVHHTIELRDITYRYPGTDVCIFKNAKVEFPVGKSIGIVGSSGGGKTTMIDIMLGLLKPESGEVLADGVNIRTNYPGWLKNIGYIPQSIYMLDTTIRRNVAFGVPDEQIDDEKVWKALKEAQLDEHVRSLPEGLDTEIGQHGITFSGGQRQRIGIARALFEDPEVLVLDEATSALDNETEAAIMDSVNRLHGRKTLIIIAHRLETIEKCDIVLRVQDQGVVRER
ncbi:ABC-type multidrug transport system, ATPase and permease component [Lachnospiraceae bacterium NK3A20]|nr:ABC-type multidrug transport system, ATPase and permease component [Lachnospiraceae bacterium NK3A20]